MTKVTKVSRFQNQENFFSINSKSFKIYLGSRPKHPLTRPFSPSDRLPNNSQKSPSTIPFAGLNWLRQLLLLLAPARLVLASSYSSRRRVMSSGSSSPSIGQSIPTRPSIVAQQILSGFLRSTRPLWIAVVTSPRLKLTNESMQKGVPDVGSKETSLTSSSYAFISIETLLTKKFPNLSPPAITPPQPSSRHPQLVKRSRKSWPIVSKHFVLQLILISEKLAMTCVRKIFCPQTLIEQRGEVSRSLEALRTSFCLQMSKSISLRSTPTRSLPKQMSIVVGGPSTGKLKRWETVISLSLFSQLQTLIDGKRLLGWGKFECPMHVPKQIRFFPSLDVSEATDNTFQSYSKLMFFSISQSLLGFRNKKCDCHLCLSSFLSTPSVRTPSRSSKSTIFLPGFPSYLSLVQSRLPNPYISIKRRQFSQQVMKSVPGIPSRQMSSM